MMHGRMQDTVAYVAFLGSTLCLATGDAIIKAIPRGVDPNTIAFSRLFGILLVGVVLASIAKDTKCQSHGLFDILQVTRSCLFLAGILLVILSIKKTSLTQTHAFIAVAPLITVILARVILLENVRKIFWIYLLFSTLGVILLVKPHYTEWSYSTLLPAILSVIMALYILTTRMLSHKYAAPSLLIHLGIVGLIGITPFVDWADLSLAAENAVALAGIAVSGALAQYLIVFSLARAPASSLQPIQYTLFIWILIFDEIFFHARISMLELLGATMVVIFGVAAAFGGRRKIAKDVP